MNFPTTLKANLIFFQIAIFLVVEEENFLCVAVMEKPTDLSSKLEKTSDKTRELSSCSKYATTDWTRTRHAEQGWG